MGGTSPIQQCRPDNLGYGFFESLSKFTQEWDNESLRSVWLQTIASSLGGVTTTSLFPALFRTKLGLGRLLGFGALTGGILEAGVLSFSDLENQAFSIAANDALSSAVSMAAGSIVGARFGNSFLAQPLTRIISGLGQEFVGRISGGEGRIHSFYDLAKYFGVWIGAGTLNGAFKRITSNRISQRFLEYPFNILMNVGESGACNDWGFQSADFISAIGGAATDLVTTGIHHGTDSKRGLPSSVAEVEKVFSKVDFASDADLGFKLKCALKAVRYGLAGPYAFRDHYESLAPGFPLDPSHLRATALRVRENLKKLMVEIGTHDPSKQEQLRKIAKRIDREFAPFTHGNETPVHPDDPLRSPRFSTKKYKRDSEILGFDSGKTTLGELAPHVLKVVVGDNGNHKYGLHELTGQAKMSFMKACGIDDPSEINKVVIDHQNPDSGGYLYSTRSGSCVRFVFNDNSELVIPYSQNRKTLAWGVSMPRCVIDKKNKFPTLMWVDDFLTTGFSVKQALEKARSYLLKKNDSGLSSNDFKLKNPDNHTGSIKESIGPYHDSLLRELLEPQAFTLERGPILLGNTDAHSALQTLEVLFRLHSAGGKHIKNAEWAYRFVNDNLDGIRSQLAGSLFEFPYGLTSALGMLDQASAYAKKYGHDDSKITAFAQELSLCIVDHTEWVMNTEMYGSRLRSQSYFNLLNPLAEVASLMDPSCPAYEKVKNLGKRVLNDYVEAQNGENQKIEASFLPRRNDQEINLDKIGHTPSGAFAIKLAVAILDDQELNTFLGDIQLPTEAFPFILSDEATRLAFNDDGTPKIVDSYNFMHVINSDTFLWGGSPLGANCRWSLAYSALAHRLNKSNPGLARQYRKAANDLLAPFDDPKLAGLILTNYNLSHWVPVDIVRAST